MVSTRRPSLGKSAWTTQTPRHSPPFAMLSRCRDVVSRAATRSQWNDCSGRGSSTGESGDASESFTLLEHGIRFETFISTFHGIPGTVGRSGSTRRRRAPGFGAVVTWVGDDRVQPDNFARRASTAWCRDPLDSRTHSHRVHQRESSLPRWSNSRSAHARQAHSDHARCAGSLRPDFGVHTAQAVRRSPRDRGAMHKPPGPRLACRVLRLRYALRLREHTRTVPQPVGLSMATGPRNGFTSMRLERW